MNPTLKWAKWKISFFLGHPTFWLAGGGGGGGLKNYKPLSHCFSIEIFFETDQIFFFFFFFFCTPFCGGGGGGGKKNITSYYPFNMMNFGEKSIFFFFFFGTPYLVVGVKKYHKLLPI